MTSISSAARLLSAVILVAALATAPLDSAAARIASILVAAAVLIATRPLPRPFLKRLALLLPAIVALILPLWLRHGPWLASAIAFRAALALVVALSVGSTIAPAELAGALRGLGVPSSLASTIAAMLRQARLLGAEGKRLLLARRLRGARGLALSADVLSALLVRTERRARQADLGMRLRGAGASAMAKASRLGWQDAPAVAASAALAACPYVAQLIAAGTGPQALGPP